MKLIKTLVCTFIVLFSTNVFAEENEIWYENSTVACASSKTVQKSLKEYGEKPIVIMNSSRIMIDKNGDEEKTEFPTMLFSNNKTGTWSLVEKREKNLYCVISIGKGIKFNN